MMRKGGTGEWAFRIVLIILLIIIAFYIYQSWVALTTLQMFRDNPKEATEHELDDYIRDINDFIKKILGVFL